MDEKTNQKTSQRLLLLLKTHGPQSTKDLSHRLEITVPAVRRHLESLDGEVESHSVRQGVGRPSSVWRLTEAAQARFPDTHAEMTVRILESMSEVLGDAAVDAVIEDRAKKNLARYRNEIPASQPLAERIRRLAQLREEEGYMAEVTEISPGVWRLVEHHCPICAAATACRGFCRNELQLFETLLNDAEVVRDEYLLDGGERCGYRITAR